MESGGLLSKRFVSKPGFGAGKKKRANKISSIVDLRITLTNNEINHIIILIRSLENRVTLLKENIEKVKKSRRRITQ